MSAGSSLGRSRRNRFDSALEVVAYANDVPRQLGDCVLGRVLFILLRTFADVLHLRVGPQPLVLELGALSLQRGDHFVHRPSGLAASAGLRAALCCLAADDGVVRLGIGIVGLHR